VPRIAGHAVLRVKPKAAACWSMVRYPASTNAVRISRIFAAWTAFNPELTFALVRIEPVSHSCVA
jgi:hypothetical protein